MFEFILISGQLFFILMMGIFYRSSQFTEISSTSYITYGFILILGFTFMYCPYRKLNLFSLILLILVTFISIQTYFLSGKFFDSCFDYFRTEVQIDSKFIVRSLFGALAVMVTCLDFIGLFEYWQIYVVISVIMTIGYSLISSIILYGLDVYDGGGGVTVFLYSGIVSLIIWFMSVRGKISILQHKKSQSYLNYTLIFIGVVISFFSWPIFNMGGSLTTFMNTNLTSNNSLLNSSYINTLCALSMSIISSLILSESNSANKTDKMKPKLYVQCFVNGGIIIATYNDLALNPVCGMVLAMVASILTLVLDKYIFQKIDVRNQSDVKIIMFKYSKLLFRIIFSLIGVCIAAIVIATRESNINIVLLTSGSYSQKAGLTIVGWIIGLVFGIVFGAIISVIINLYLKHRQSLQQKQQDQKVVKIVDELFFQQISQQIYPIYKDFLDISIDTAYEQDLTRRILNQSLLKHSQIPVNIYETNKRQQIYSSNQNKQVQKQTILIRNDFSKSNLLSSLKDINLSAMKKVSRDSQNNSQIAGENQHNNQYNQNQSIDKQYSPIKRLQIDDNKNKNNSIVNKHIQDNNKNKISLIYKNNNNINNSNNNNINNNNNNSKINKSNNNNNFRAYSGLTPQLNFESARPQQNLADNPSESKKSGLISPRVQIVNEDESYQYYPQKQKNIIKKKLNYQNRSYVEEEEIVDLNRINQ